MFGFFKKLLGREKGTVAEKVVLPAVAPIRSTATVPPPITHDIPAPKMIQPAVEGNISLPLKPIVQNLPKVLQDLVTHQPTGEARIELPLRFVLPQLARGSVQIAFGDLKQLSPPTTFSPSIRYDQEWISIPLQLVIPLVPTESITRRTDQKRVQVLDEIVAVFGGPGHSRSGKTKEHAVSAPIIVKSSNAAGEAAAVDTAAKPLPTLAPSPRPPEAKPLPPSPQAPRLPMSPIQPALPISPKGMPTLPGIAVPGADRIQSQPPTPVAPLPSSTFAPSIPPETRSISMPQPGFGQSAFGGPAAPTVPPAPAPPPISFEPRPAPLSPPIAPLPVTRPPGPPLPVQPTPVLPKPEPGGGMPPMSFGAPPAPAPITMPAPGPRPEPPPAPTAPAAAVEPALEYDLEAGTLTIPLGAVSSAWPDPVKAEVSQLSLAQATIALPCALADQSIKQGKLAFTWKQLRAWATPSAPAGYESAQDDQLLELPLAVVVPLYFAQRKPVRSGKLMNVPDVPDLFARPAAKPSDAMVATPPQGAPAAAPPVPVHAAPSTAAAPSPVPAAPAAPPPSVSITPAAGQPTPDIGQVFGQAGKRHWTPAEIVQKTATLPGVSGSLIAMQDGLLVACQMPANLNGEMIAAFLPQMFGRMSHYTSELKLGEPSSVLLMVNQMPLQINRVGRVFYTVLGKPGEPLPSPAIAAVVVQLDLQSKQI